MKEIRITKCHGSKMKILKKKDFWMSMEGAGGTKRFFIQEYVEQNEKSHHAVREIATKTSSLSSKQILGPGGRPK